MPFPKSHVQEMKDDCFRCALAFYLDKHPSRVKYFKPNDKYTMYRDYEEWIEERIGLTLLRFSTLEAINFFLEQDKQWIAIVPSGSETHAIVMKGSKLVYDPNGPMGRKRKPRKILEAFVLADDVHHHKDDNTVSFIY